MLVCGFLKDKQAGLLVSVFWKDSQAGLQGSEGMLQWGDDRGGGEEGERGDDNHDTEFFIRSESFN